jgi:hypothetical protein
VPKRERLRKGGGGLGQTLTTSVTKVRWVAPTLPVTRQQPSDAKMTPLAQKASPLKPVSGQPELICARTGAQARPVCGPRC